MESTNKAYWKIYTNWNSAEKMIRYDENFDNDYILPFVIHPQTDLDRGKVQLCHNNIANLLEKVNRPCKQNFPEVNIKNQIVDHY